MIYILYDSTCISIRNYSSTVAVLFFHITNETMNKVDTNSVKHQYRTAPHSVRDICGIYVFIAKANLYRLQLSVVVLYLCCHSYSYFLFTSFKFQSLVIYNYQCNDVIFTTADRKFICRTTV